jgi:hypothetical protein
MALQDEKIKFILSNEFDNSTLSSTFAPPAGGSMDISSSLPLDNLKRISRSKVCRTTAADLAGTYTWTISGTLSEFKPVSGVALARYNLNPETLIRVKLYSDKLYTTLVYDSGDVLAAPPFPWGSFGWGDSEVPWGIGSVGSASPVTFYFFSSVLVGSFEIIITSTLSIGDFMELSRIFMGEAVTPKFNISYGHSLMHKEDTKQVRTYGGTLRSSQTSVPYRVMKFTFPTMLEDDRLKIFKLLYKTGKRKDILVSVYPDATTTPRGAEYTMIGKFTNDVGFTEILNQIYSTDSITIEEV